jgi:hydroxymethylbilane synthase
MLQAIHSPSTFASVVKEREILASYGGGCHQKIGVSVLDRPYGRITYLQGLTDAGEKLDQAALNTFEALPRCQGVAHLFPRDGEESPFFTRKALPRGIWSRAEQVPRVFVARDTAWPDGFRTDGLVWTAGLKTWKKLASRGVWVLGSSENLGEREVESVSTLSRAISGEGSWTKLTHEQAAAGDEAAVATYSLEPSVTPPDLRGRTHFYWMSGTAFDRAVELYPEIVGGVHACGAGKTVDHLKEKLGKTPFVYLSVEQFRRAALS